MLPLPRCCMILVYPMKWWPLTILVLKDAFNNKNRPRFKLVCFCLRPVTLKRGVFETSTLKFKNDEYMEKRGRMAAFVHTASGGACTRPKAYRVNEGWIFGTTYRIVYDAE